MKSYLSILFLFALSLASCSEILEPEIIDVKNVEINEMNRSKLDIDAVMVLKNDNSFALDLASTSMKAYVDDIEMATIDQSFDTKMPANATFDMPININMDLEKLYRDNPIAALGKGMQIMSDRKLLVKFVGTIRVGKGVAKLTIPIDQEEMVEF